VSGRSIAHILKREFKSYFLSPVAYIVISLFLIVTGWFFFSVFFIAGRTDLRDFFSMLPIVLAFAIPAITMRCYAEEIKSGSFEILLTLPVTQLEILLGKYMAALGFIVIMFIPTLSYPLFISSLGDLDWGPVGGGYIGTVLLAGSFCAVGLLASSLTRNQIVAFMIGLAICFFLTIVDRMLIFFPTIITGVLQFIGADFHFRNISKGVLDSRDLAYFLSLGFIALYGTHIVVKEKE
jgi:ABC-2 type transport system permease protein